ncbi:MAG: DUF167 family protein [Armatimonadota bacterium]|nr:DUF167 family protein [Armatimonadota bacterium]
MGGQPLIRAVEGGVLLRVRVQPASRHEGIRGVRRDAVLVAVHAPPEGRRANEATRRVLASALGVSPSAVDLVRGQASRQKEFRIQGIHPEDVQARLQKLLEGAREDRRTLGPRPSPNSRPNA